MNRVCVNCHRIAATVRGYCHSCRPAQQRHRNQQPARAAHHTATHKTVSRIVYARDGHVCACCAATDDLTIDYITPLIRGGRQHASNAQVLCRPCNSRKGATPGGFVF